MYVAYENTLNFDRHQEGMLLADLAGSLLCKEPKQIVTNSEVSNGDALAGADFKAVAKGPTGVST